MNVEISEEDFMDLPTELIHVVSQKLPDIRDYIRFRAVCKKWRLSAPVSDLPPQLPWILQFEVGSGTPGLKKSLGFLSLATGETGCIPIPKSYHGRKYKQLCHIHLLLSDKHGQSSHQQGNPPPTNEEVLSLFNPLTNEEIPLPPLPSNTVYFFPVFSSSCPRNWHSVMLLKTGTWHCSIYHTDTFEWKYFEISLQLTCCSDGMLVTSRKGGHTQVFDVTTGKQMYEIPPISEEEEASCVYTYLVESYGAILKVFLFMKSSGVLKLEESYFHIYRLDFQVGVGQPCWVRLSDIGDQILFLDFMYGFSMRTPVGFKGNCIFFIKNQDRNGPNAIGRYDISYWCSRKVALPL